MPLLTNHSLQSNNTLGVPVNAKYFFAVKDLEELEEAVNYAHNNQLPILVIGEGSNLVFTKDYSGLVIKIEIYGIDVVAEQKNYSLVRAGAGERWQTLVDYTLSHHLWGLENLTGIPGTVGAAPIQNIGAYGVELKNHFVELQALDLQAKCIVTFDLAACCFGYRESVFKQAQKGRYIITHVTLKLSHEPHLVMDYEPLRQRLSNCKNISPQILAQVVKQIRDEKLPSPDQLPNVGSFFKNPIVSRQHFIALQQKFPAIVGFPAKDDFVKLAAGWLIEQAGWKGYRSNGVGVHQNQALVLINYEQKSGAEVLALANKIQSSIKQRFEIDLEIEPSVF